MEADGRETCVTLAAEVTKKATLPLAASAARRIRLLSPLPALPSSSLSRLIRSFSGYSLSLHHSLCPLILPPRIPPRCIIQQCRSVFLPQVRGEDGQTSIKVKRDCANVSGSDILTQCEDLSVDRETTP